MSHTLTSLRDHFLISMPHLHDETFTQTVVYICDHSEYGAMGLSSTVPAVFACVTCCHTWSWKTTPDSGPNARFSMAVLYGMIAALYCTAPNRSSSGYPAIPSMTKSV